MLKRHSYDGFYRDENISISILLENPTAHDLETNELVFSVTLKARKRGICELNDFTFYVMDEANCLHNTQIIPYSKNSIKNSEPTLLSSKLIRTRFRSYFLFQDLRIAFYYPPYQNIAIINLKH